MTEQLLILCLNNATLLIAYLLTNVSTGASCGEWDLESSPFIVERLIDWGMGDIALSTYPCSLLLCSSFWASTDRQTSLDEDCIVDTDEFSSKSFTDSSCEDVVPSMFDRVISHTHLYMCSQIPHLLTIYKEYVKLPYFPSFGVTLYKLKTIKSLKAKWICDHHHPPWDN